MNITEGIPYLILFSVLLAATVLCCINKKLCKASEVIVFFVLLLFLGLRYKTGSDWSIYMQYYDTISWGNTKYFIGFQILTMVCRYIFRSYCVLQFFTAGIFLFALFRFCKKHADHCMLCVIYTVYDMFTNIMMSQLRQEVAIAFILFAVDALLEKKKRKFWLFFILAVSFHPVALVALVFLFFQKGYALYISIGVLLIAITLTVYYPATDALFDIIRNLPDNPITGRVRFADSVNDPWLVTNVKISTGIGVLIRLGLLSFPAVYYLFPQNRKKKNPLFINSLYLTLAFTVLALRVPICLRVQFVFFVFAACAVIDAIFDFLKLKDKKCRQIIVCGSLGFLLMALVSKSALSTRIDKNGYPECYPLVPYYSVFTASEQADAKLDWIDRYAHPITENEE